jgi:ornithine cyclodeaminase/alanine dehydrogenase-like protein (mu-crystallin family)
MAGRLVVALDPVGSSSRLVRPRTGKSVGVAAQDAAAAMLVLRAAEARGVGTTLDL